MQRTAVVILLLSLFLSVATPAPVQAREGIRVIYESASYIFAQKMVFEVAIEGELREANLFYQIEGETGQHYHRATINDGTATEVIFLRPGEIPPAAEITYFWRLEDVNGYLLRTEERSFLYLDQQLPWQSQERGDTTIFWYGKDRQFADTVLTHLDRSFTHIKNKLGLTQKEPIKVVIYQSSREMQRALPQQWGGQPVITLGVAFNHRTLVLFLDWGWERTLTHELTHLLTFQLMGEPYDYLPFWLCEGLATYTEGRSRGPITEPLRLSYLSSKPTKPELVGPAYAQAQSIVTFLVEEHGGKEKVNRLLTTLAEGATVDDASLTVYGFDRRGLERKWRDWLGYPLPEEETSIGIEVAAIGELIELVIALLLVLIVLPIWRLKR